MLQFLSEIIIYRVIYRLGTYLPTYTCLLLLFVDIPTY